MQFNINKNNFNIAMLKKGYTTRELAKRTKLSTSTITRAMSTNKKLNIKTIKKIADALNVDADTLAIVNND